MTPVGFEPKQLALVELESTPLDHSGKVSMKYMMLSLQFVTCRGKADWCLEQRLTTKSKSYFLQKQMKSYRYRLNA